MAAFVRAVAKKESLPKPEWRYEDQKDGSVRLTVTSSVPCEDARLYVAEAKTLDFRDARWRKEAMAKDGEAWRAEAERPASGARAVFGEVVYSIDGIRFTLSTQVRILEARKPRRWF